MKAHHDDKVKWEELSHDAQLNAACNAGAKAMIQRQDITDLPQQEAFLLKPICMFVEGKKMTSDTGPHIRYAAGQQVVRLFFHEHWHFCQSRLAKCSPHAEQVSAQAISGVGMQASDEYLRHQ